MSLLLWNCEKEEVFNEDLQLETGIFSKPEYQNIKLKLEQNIYSISPADFENKYGLPFYESTIALQSKFNTIVIPFYNNRSKRIKGWMTGFYTDDNQIKFMYSSATKKQINALDLKKGKLILTDKKITKSVKKENSKYLSKQYCGAKYRLICGTVEAEPFVGETSCLYVYEGETCIDYGEEQDYELEEYSNDDNDTDSTDPNDDWSNPFLCPTGQVQDSNGNCVTDCTTLTK